MAKINVNDLQPGMVLNTPVITPMGAVLLNQGVMINEKHISIFKKWGIWEIDIQGLSDQEADAENERKLTPEEMDRIHKELSEHFIMGIEHPVMNEIFRIIKKIKIQEVLKERQ